MHRPSPERGEEHTNGILMVMIGYRSKKKKKTLIAASRRADADIFIQLAQLTVIKENETLRLVCVEGRKTREDRNQRVSSVT